MFSKMFPPPPAVYPLVASTAAAVSLCAYSCYRHLVVDPEVRVDKAARADATAEGPKVAADGEAYKRSFLRTVAQFGARNCGDARFVPHDAPALRSVSDDSYSWLSS
jgi:hypothetical protein